VTDVDKAIGGGGVDDEIIEVVKLSLEKAKRMIQQAAVNKSPPSCLMCPMRRPRGERCVITLNTNQYECFPADPHCEGA